MPEMPPTFRPANMPRREDNRRMYDQRRDDREQRRWYKTARWQKLKLRVHVRDLYVCQATGVMCSGKYPADNSPVADHIIEPEGDPDLFWSIDNIRTVTKEFHDGERQREQRGFRPFSIPRNVLKSGVPVTLVCGPPGSGKTTWVRKHMRAGDTVIDFDDIRQRLGFKRYEGGQVALRAAFVERDKMIRRLARMVRGRAWLVIMAPTDAERKAWVKALGDVEVVEMDASADVCRERIKADTTRRGAVPQLLKAVDVWFSARSATPGGVVKSPQPLHQ
uniref:ATP-binding protein n=1 Tax=Hoeflea sp. TaxID=1940281 RepID=UPI002AFDE9F8